MNPCNYCEAGWEKDSAGHHRFPVRTMKPYSDMQWICRKDLECDHSVPSGRHCIYCGVEWSGMANVDWGGNVTEVGPTIR